MKKRNNNFFEVMIQKQSTIGIFVGHDHVNHCDILYNGIRFNYGLKSSRFSYYDDTLLGGKSIVLKCDNFDTKLVYFSQMD